MVAPVNRCQSPISTANPNPVKRGDAAQAAEPAHHSVYSLLLGHRGDRGVQPVPPLHR